MFTAIACGLTAWENVMRASCQKPAVTATCEVYEEEAAAICALVAFRPQLICVQAKWEMDELAKNVAIKGVYQTILLHYKELSPADKASDPFYC